MDYFKPAWISTLSCSANELSNESINVSPMFSHSTTQAFTYYFISIPYFIYLISYERVYVGTWWCLHASVFLLLSSLGGRIRVEDCEQQDRSEFSHQFGFRSRPLTRKLWFTGWACTLVKTQTTQKLSKVCLTTSFFKIPTQPYLHTAAAHNAIFHLIHLLHESTFVAR